MTTNNDHPQPATPTEAIAGNPRTHRITTHSQFAVPLFAQSHLADAVASLEAEEQRATEALEQLAKAEQIVSGLVEKAQPDDFHRAQLVNLLPRFAEVKHNIREEMLTPWPAI